MTDSERIGACLKRKYDVTRGWYTKHESSLGLPTRDEVVERVVARIYRLRDHGLVIQGWLRPLI